MATATHSKKNHTSTFKFQLHIQKKIHTGTFKFNGPIHSHSHWSPHSHFVWQQLHIQKISYRHIQILWTNTLPLIYHHVHILYGNSYTLKKKSYRQNHIQIWWTNTFTLIHHHIHILYGNSFTFTFRFTFIFDKAIHPHSHWSRTQIFWGQTNFWPKSFWGKKISDPKNFVSKNVRPKLKSIFFYPNTILQHKPNLI